MEITQFSVLVRFSLTTWAKFSYRENLLARLAGFVTASNLSQKPINYLPKMALFPEIDKINWFIDLNRM